MPPRVAQPPQTGYVLVNSAMQDEIERLMYGAQAYTSARSLWQHMRGLTPAQLAGVGGKAPSLASVRKVFAAQSPTQQLAPAPAVDRRDYSTIVAKWPGSDVKVDLVEFTNRAQARWNNPSGLRRDGQPRSRQVTANTFKYVFLAHDTYSRRSWWIPLKQKTAGELIRALEEVRVSIDADPQPLDPRGEQKLGERWGVAPGTRKRLLSISSDGESGLQAAQTKAWCKDNGVRLWLTPKPVLGPGRTYLAERNARQLREMIRRKWTINGNMVWAVPNKPIDADDPAQRTVLQEIEDDYNLRHWHSTLKNTPMEVWMGAPPAYQKTADEKGVCTKGRKCTRGQLRGIKRRDTAGMLAVGDVCKLAVAKDLFEKDGPNWSEGNWAIVATDSPAGLSKYVAGWSVPQGEALSDGRPMQKPGEGMRYLVQSVDDPSEMRTAMWYDLRKVSPASRTYSAAAAASGGRATAPAADMKPKKGSAAAARGSVRDQKRLASALTRMAQQEGIEQSNVVRTRRVARPQPGRAAKSGGAAAPAAPKKAKAAARPAQGKLAFAVGERVAVQFATTNQGPQWFPGTVVRASPMSTRVEFDDGVKVTYQRADWSRVERL